MDAAQPGWEIVVEDGTYFENVCIGKTPLHTTPTPDGILQMPILLRARNRLGTKIRPSQGGAPGIGGGGAEYWTIDGFDVACGTDGATGGFDAVSFTCNGTKSYARVGESYADPIRGITVRYCRLLTVQPGADAVHMAGGYDVTVTDCDCTASNDQGIDFGGISRGEISRNTVANTAGGAAGIVLKLGTVDISVADNAIVTASVGISIGDVSGDIMPNPDNVDSEARRITLARNTIRITSGTNAGLRFVGAWDCTETETVMTFDGNRGAASDVRITSEAANYGRRQIFSTNTQLAYSTRVMIDGGNS